MLDSSLNQDLLDNLIPYVQAKYIWVPEKIITYLLEAQSNSISWVIH